MAVKDSGKRQEFASGMVRDVEEDKIDYTLIMDGPMYDRWAAHLTDGAKKYVKRNWMKAANVEEWTRFRTSAARHFRQWMRGDTDEDHAAAVIFNLNGAEYVKPLLREDYNFAVTHTGQQATTCSWCGRVQGHALDCVVKPWNGVDLP